MEARHVVCPHPQRGRAADPVPVLATRAHHGVSQGRGREDPEQGQLADAVPAGCRPGPNLRRQPQVGHVEAVATLS